MNPPDQPHAQTPEALPRYFVIPNLPRDVWYGYPDKPESAQLVAFVEMRHAHINKAFDATYTAEALNQSAFNQHASLTARAALCDELAEALLGLGSVIAKAKDSNDGMEALYAFKLDATKKLLARHAALAQKGRTT